MLSKKRRVARKKLKRSSAQRKTSPPSARKRVKPTFIDLFAGIGGMRSAFESAGGTCVYTSEYDAYAQRTYMANFPGPVDGDITQVDPKSIPDHNILVAGFPCQPFSIAGVSKKKSLGRAHGFDDPTQGTLFFNVKEIIRVKQPDAFLLENVKNLLSHDKGQTFAVIRHVLEEELGYSLHYRVLDGKAFVPQHRERIFIVGFKKPRDFFFPELPKQGPKLDSILEDIVPSKYTLSDKLWNYLQRYAEKHRAKGNGFGFGLVGKDDISRTLSARYYKDGSEILIKQPRKNPRRLTPTECIKLMGFPESFKIPESISDTRAYKQFGNSVVVPLVRVVACEILRALGYPVSEDAAPKGQRRSAEQLRVTLNA